MPGLDGLRALAVVAVLLYHAGVAWLPGGFLGVEVFFVISGFLISALLVAEWRHKGRISLKDFWFRRARRPLPALYLLLVVTPAYAVVFLPGEVAGLRGDAVSALGYATNWYLIFGNEPYFEAIGQPSLLRHLWSLAVEEQFYLLWPPVLAVGVSLGARRYRPRRLGFVALAGAGASALLMASMFVPEADPSRIYYGADTRAAGLLIGAALALAWRPADRASREVCSRLQRLNRPHPAASAASGQHYLRAPRRKIGLPATDFLGRLFVSQRTTPPRDGWILTGVAADAGGGFATTRTGQEPGRRTV